MPSSRASGNLRDTHFSVRSKFSRLQPLDTRDGTMESDDRWVSRIHWHEHDGSVIDLVAYAPYGGGVRFVWDEAKNSRNRKEHGLSFEPASALFTRGNEYLEIFDEAHSSGEDRFIAIGPISRGLVLVVYTEQEDDLIRIISARFATARETAMYRASIGGVSP